MIVEELCEQMKKNNLNSLQKRRKLRLRKRLKTRPRRK